MREGEAKSRENAVYCDGRDEIRESYDTLAQDGYNVNIINIYM